MAKGEVLRRSRNQVARGGRKKQWHPEPAKREAHGRHYEAHGSHSRKPRAQAESVSVLLAPTLGGGALPARGAKRARQARRT